MPCLYSMGLFQWPRLKWGILRGSDTIFGPLINRKQVNRILELIDKTVQQGAKVVLEGKVKGDVISPFILRDVTNDMAIAQEEIFGPVAGVIAVDSEEEAIRVANDSPYGLSGAVHARSLEYGVEVAKKIKTGMIHVNDQSVNDEPIIAFGGEKASGLGRYGGEWALDEFKTVKWISVQIILVFGLLKKILEYKKGTGCSYTICSLYRSWL